MPEFWSSTTEGLHEPVIPFVDVLGNTGTVPLSQITRLVPKGKVGVVLCITVIVIVIGNPQVLALGVKVYEPVAVLLTVDGLHVPVIPFNDAGGNIGAVVPSQKGGKGLKVGTNIGSDKMIPVKRLVVQPLISKVKLE